MPALRSVVIHCQDPYVMAPFWSAALGMAPVPEDVESLTSHSLEPGESVLLKSEGGHPDVWITPVEHLDPPGNRLHLDLDCDESGVRALVEAGARVVREERRWTVLADPEDNEFCAVPPSVTEET